MHRAVQHRATHRSRRQPDVEQLCAAVEAHGTSVAMALLWVIPVVALLAALLRL